MEGKLKFEFEYYGRGTNEGDYEFIHAVDPEEFSTLAMKFGLDPHLEILDAVRKISDLCHGVELKKALTNKEIKNELFTWLSAP